MTLLPNNGTDTSIDAAKSMEDAASSLRDRVLDLIRASGYGLTTDEIEKELDANHQTVSPRVWELHKCGLIGDSGNRRKTRSGRWAKVYRALTTEEVTANAQRTAAELNADVSQLELPFLPGEFQ